AQPVVESAWFVGSCWTEVEADRAVDRTLLDRILAQDTILGVDPRAGRAVSLLAVGPGADAVIGTRLTADKEVAVRLIGDHRAVPRLVEHRVANVRAFDVPVV